MPVRMEITMSGDREIGQIFQRLIDVDARMEPIFQHCVTLIRKSVLKTFQEGGRPKWPERWDPLNSLLGTSKKVKGTVEVKAPLQVTGRLRQSVVQAGQGAAASDSFVTITKNSMAYGTLVEYARTQQEGGPSKVKVPQKKIRYRKSDNVPYVVLHGKGGFFVKHLDSDGTFTINVRPRPFLQLFSEDVDAITEVFRAALQRIMDKKT